MSEEFSLHVSFENASKESLELLKKVESCFDNKSFEDLREIFSTAGFDLASQQLQENIANTFSSYSDYKDYFDGDCARGLIETARENGPQLSLKSKKGVVELLIEGHDRGGDDFCTFFMAFLSILDLSKLSGSARSDNGWFGEWTESDRKLSATFQEAEEW